MQQGFFPFFPFLLHCCVPTYITPYTRLLLQPASRELAHITGERRKWKSAKISPEKKGRVLSKSDAGPPTHRTFLAVIPFPSFVPFDYAPLPYPHALATLSFSNLSSTSGPLDLASIVVLYNHLDSPHTLWSSYLGDLHPAFLT
ncbi:hypothetical protein LZ32DRAFT_339985 [Colletotrichum eremochloae]|nr:hypothetical protein LZ32DRAFT_339985 [Colletotrichum eremochloae]